MRETEEVYMGGFADSVIDVSRSVYETMDLTQMCELRVKVVALLAELDSDEYIGRFKARKRPPKTPRRRVGGDR